MHKLKFKSPRTIMITGAAGYVGAMLCDQFSKCPELQKVVAIDTRPMPAILKDNKKIIWITADLLEGIWKIPAMVNKPEVIIHCAWSNGVGLDISRAVFDFFFKNQFVKKLVYFGTVASIEEHPENESPYGEEKRQVVDLLKKMYEEDGSQKQVFVLRPASITGPRDRFLGNGGSLPFILVGADDWRKQYIHEDDVVDIVAMLTFNTMKGGCFDVYALAPDDSISAAELASLVGKTLVKLPPFFVRLVCGITSVLPRGGWKSLCYPTLVNGKKIVDDFGFRYGYTSCEALTKDDGRYSEINEEENAR